VLDNKGYERLVLTACHPPFSAAERLIIFAKLIRMAPADRDAPEV
jgi:sortase (surface protein transpeptidase)